MHAHVQTSKIHTYTCTCTHTHFCSCDAQARSWDEKFTNYGPLSRRKHSAAAYQERMWIFGGEDSRGLRGTGGASVEQNEVETEA